MRVRWTTDAAEDLERISDYIAETSDSSSGRVAAAIFERAAALRTFPNRGRRGRVEGTREPVLAPLPFIVVYGVSDEVRILRILHGARRWPPP